MKRKRLEAWGIKDALGYLYNGVAFDDPSAGLGVGQVPAKGAGVVRLVECGPDEVPMPKRAAAVVRAAVKWATGEKYGGSVGLVGDLLRAVERMQKGRRK